jgi:hypothetical protein
VRGRTRSDIHDIARRGMRCVEIIWGFPRRLLFCAVSAVSYVVSARRRVEKVEDGKTVSGLSYNQIHADYLEGPFAK